MPRFSQRMHKTRKSRKTRKHQRNTKKTRRVKHRKQRGGIANVQHNMQELKDQLFSLITNHQDYDQIVEFVHNQI